MGGQGNSPNVYNDRSDSIVFASTGNATDFGNTQTSLIGPFGLSNATRGIYGGAIGHISWNGNIDTAIAIRTAVIKDGLIHVGAGAGIVADSDPETEWRECVQKSKVFADAMEMIS